MTVKHLFTVSNDFIELFNKNNYEKYVLEIMNNSKIIFPNSYIEVSNQSQGQCDFIDSVTNEKYDAKLPFLPEQVRLLTDGKKHKPEIEKWIFELQKESTEYNPLAYRDDPQYLENIKLYKIIKMQVQKDKEDENIVFFLPYPITISLEGSFFFQSLSDFISVILNNLKEVVQMGCRNIFIIYPSSKKNSFVLRSTRDVNNKEYVTYDGMEKYFSHEIVDVDVSK